MLRHLIYAIVPSPELEVAIHYRTLHVDGQLASLLLVYLLEAAKLVLPLLDDTAWRCPIGYLSKLDKLPGRRGCVPAPQVCGVQVLAAEDGTVRKQGLCRRVDHLGARTLLAKPTVWYDMLARRMSLPFVLASKGRVAPGPVEDTLVWHGASMSASAGTLVQRGGENAHG